MNFRTAILVFLLLTPIVGFSSEYIKLSDYFYIKRVKSLLNSDYTQIFYTPMGSKQYKLIGNVDKENWDKPFSGKALTSLKRSVFAISKDGRSILYRHRNKGFFSQNKVEGVYWFHVEKGDRLIYTKNILINGWNRYDKELPKNVMVIEKAAEAEKLLKSNKDTMALYAEDASLKPLGLYGGNQLHEAVWINDIEKVKILLKQGLDLNALTYWAYSPLDIAIKKGFDDIAVYLIEQGADYINAKRLELYGEHSTIEAAVFLQRWKVLRAMHKRGAKLDDPKLLYKAMPYNHTELLADNTTQVNDKDIPRMVRLLINDGADPGAKGLTIITALIENDRLRGSSYQLEVLSLLLKAGANPNAIRLDKSEYNLKRTALHHVAADRKWDIEDAKSVMRLLAKYSDNLEHKDKFGRTALQTSMLRLDFNGSYEKALYLIELGASGSDEYLFGSGGRPTGITIREKLVEHGAHLQ